MEKSQAADYLSNLLNKTLRISTTDTRLFIGEFKCTDSDRNIILSRTHEYRQPTQNEDGKIAWTSRFLGLIVVPGEYITKIEVEEFASQVKGKGKAI